MPDARCGPAARRTLADNVLRCRCLRRVPLRLYKVGAWKMTADYNGASLVPEEAPEVMVAPALIMSPARSSLQGVQHHSRCAQMPGKCSAPINMVLQHQTLALFAAGSTSAYVSTPLALKLIARDEFDNLLPYSMIDTTSVAIASTPYSASANFSMFADSDGTPWVLLRCVPDSLNASRHSTAPMILPSSCHDSNLQVQRVWVV
jgi:hypothetical protein